MPGLVCPALPSFEGSSFTKYKMFVRHFIHHSVTSTYNLSNFYWNLLSKYKTVSICICKWWFEHIKLWWIYIDSEATLRRGRRSFIAITMREKGIDHGHILYKHVFISSCIHSFSWRFVAFVRKKNEIVTHFSVLTICAFHSSLEMTPVHKVLLAYQDIPFFHYEDFLCSFLAHISIQKTFRN